MDRIGGGVGNYGIERETRVPAEHVVTILRMRRSDEERPPATMPIVSLAARTVVITISFPDGCGVAGPVQDVAKVEPRILIKRSVETWFRVNARNRVGLCAGHQWIETKWGTGSAG